MTSLKGLTVVFDLDGTLVDTAPDLIGATNHVLASIGLAPAHPERQRRMVSFGARRMIEDALTSAEHMADATAIDDFHRQFLDHYQANIALNSRVFESATAVLDRLKSDGAILSVCTNKKEDLSRRLLSEVQLLDLFDAIVGIDTLPICKPHGGHVLGAIRLAGGDPGRAVMVGDSENDVLSARGAGVPVIGCDFGYSDPPVMTFWPDALISTYNDLPEALSQLLSFQQRITASTSA